MKVLILIFSIFGLSLGEVLFGYKTTEAYNNTIELDGNGDYFLYWKFNDSHITFEVHVKTNGWVGFGLSDNGNMYPGDVVVGWVEAGKTHFSDRHTKGHSMPIKDASQDWHLLFGEERDEWTVLKFIRKIETCDTTEDLEIPKGTTRIIYAYGKTDPTSDDAITYHGATSRGTKSVNLLSTIKVPDNMPDDVIHFEFLNDNYLLPNASTTYYCRGFFLPEFGPHHMIKYEPVVTPGNEKNVHHIVIYRCSNVNRSVSENARGECYGQKPKSFPQECTDIFLAWAIGGEPFYFPKDVGFPIKDGDYYIMETHYDNPNQRTGVLDNSGIRITLTKQFRKHEAGLLELGVIVSGYQVIPPNEEAFISSGYCNAKCMNEGFRQSNLREIKAFGVLQHSHLLGVGMTTRHFRNGTELKPIVDEPAYDFNFQEFRIFPQELSIRPGDSFAVDCRYDSRGRTGPTFGGLSTQDEMCLTFLYVYPSFKVKNCYSLPVMDTYHLPPQMLSEKIRSADWTDKAFVDDFKAKLNASKHYHACMGETLQDVPGETYEDHMYPETYTPYVPPPPKCT